VRLALGYSAFALAAACFGWDYHFGFESTKTFTAIAVAVYTLLNGALTLWIARVERNTVYVGRSAATGETLRIATRVEKNVPEYRVSVEVTRKDGGKEELEFARAFSEWFDAAGHFVVAPFQVMLAGSVPLIGRADPKRAAAAAAAGKGGESDPSEAAAYTPEMLDALAKANVSVVGSAAEEATGSEAGKKGGKRRKA
jgi:hypothetical protein